MRAPSNLSRGSVSFNMTPMIDVVFLLVIFFLVSSHFAQQEVHMELDLPEAASGESPEGDDTRRLVVNVLPGQPGGQIMVGGRILQRDEWAQLIRSEADRVKQDSTSKKQQLEVRIRTDRSVPYGAVEPVMVACARAGVWNVTFAVVSGR